MPRPAAPDDIGRLCDQLNEPAREAIRQAWIHFQSQGVWPSLPSIEKTLVRALPPRTNLMMALHQTPRWVGWLGSPGHPSAMTVMLLALAACLGDESDRVLANFWRAFTLARSIHDQTPGNQAARIASDQLQAPEAAGGLNMSELEARQMQTLFQSERLLSNGHLSGPEDPYEWSFAIANRIQDFRDAASLHAYLRIRREEEVGTSLDPPVGPATGSTPAEASGPRHSSGPATRKAQKIPTNSRRRPSRKPVPQEMVDLVMFLSDRRCCICRKRDRPVQTHHLDGDPSNNVLDNLAPLCMDDHDRTLIQGGFGRHLTEGQIRLYRDEWYSTVKTKRENAAGKGKSRSKGSATTELNTTTVGYLEALKSTVDKITLDLNNAYLAERPTSIRVSDYLTEFDRSQMLLSKDFVGDCDDCYIAALQLSAALNNSPKSDKAAHDRHEKFMAASLRLRESIVREVRARRGLA